MKKRSTKRKNNTRRRKKKPGKRKEMNRKKIQKPLRLRKNSTSPSTWTGTLRLIRPMRSNWMLAQLLRPWNATCLDSNPAAESAKEKEEVEEKEKGKDVVARVRGLPREELARGDRLRLTTTSEDLTRSLRKVLDEIFRRLEAIRRPVQRNRLPM